MTENIMNWNECEKNFIREVEIDTERIESIKKKALKRLERARSPFKDDVSLAVEDYYEVVKELLIAYLLKFGIRSKNHQCLISFFYKNNPELETEANLIQQMSFYRNRLDYYGEDIPVSFYEKNKKEFESIIELLIKKVEVKDEK